MPKAKVEVGCYVRIKGQHSVGRVQTINGKTVRVLFGVMTTDSADEPFGGDYTPWWRSPFGVAGVYLS